MHDPLLLCLETLYKERLGQFVRIARAVTGDTEQARDAVQEAFARAVRARGSLRDTGAADAWVARIVINCAVEQVRGRASLATTGTPDLVDPGRESEQELRSAVARLPERQRLALFLRYYADFDYAQIASTLNIQVGTVSATLHAAREGVARLMEEVAS